MKKRRMVTAVSLVVIASISLYSIKSIMEVLETRYFLALDGWVGRGDQVRSYAQVMEVCEKLVLVSGTLSELVLLPTLQKEEFDFRTRVCAKTTVHRVHAQAELNDYQLIRDICDDDRIPVLGKLCRRSGLR